MHRDPFSGQHSRPRPQRRNDISMSRRPNLYHPDGGSDLNGRYGWERSHPLFDICTSPRNERATSLRDNGGMHDRHSGYAVASDRAFLAGSPTAASTPLRGRDDITSALIASINRSLTGAPTPALI